MISREDRHWHAVYEGLPENERKIINKAFHAVLDSLHADGAKLSMADHAECLVAAITRYYHENGGK